MESGRNPWFKSVVKVQSLNINHNEKFTKPLPLAIGTHENLIELPWTAISSLLMVLMIHLTDIERRYHHLEGEICDITSCISLWGIHYINTLILENVLGKFHPFSQTFFHHHSLRNVFSDMCGWLSPFSPRKKTLPEKRPYQTLLQHPLVRFYISPWAHMRFDIHQRV